MMGPWRDRIRVGIIGCGDGGQSNARGLQGTKGVEIVAFCDLNEERLVSAVQKFRGIGYKDFAAMLDDPDIGLVVVATPDDQHLAPVKAALEAGKHVFLEKPVATTFADLWEIGKLAEKHPGMILFQEKYSFARPIEAALAHREALGEFLAGATNYFMWRCGRIMGPDGWRVNSPNYNPIAGGLGHNFMTMRLFVGSRIRAVCGKGGVLTYDRLKANGGFDTASGEIEFENGRRLQWGVCLAIEGDGGMFAHRTVHHLFQFRDGALAYGPRADGDRLIVNGRVVPFPHEPFVEPWGEADAEERLRQAWGEYNTDLYRRMHEDNIASLLTGREPRHNIWQGIDAAAVSIRALESAKQGGKWLPLAEGVSLL